MAARPGRSLCGREGGLPSKVSSTPPFPCKRCPGCHPFREERVSCMPPFSPRIRAGMRARVSDFWLYRGRGRRFSDFLAQTWACSTDRARGRKFHPFSPRICGRELFQDRSRAVPGPELGPELPQKRMRSRSTGGAALIGERLRELPNARQIFAAIERRLDHFPRQLAKIATARGSPIQKSRCGQRSTESFKSNPHQASTLDR